MLFLIPPPCTQVLQRTIACDELSCSRIRTNRRKIRQTAPRTRQVISLGTGLRSEYTESREHYVEVSLGANSYEHHTASRSFCRPGPAKGAGGPQ